MSDPQAAEYAFQDALITLRELGHAEVADRLAERWSDVPDPVPPNPRSIEA